MTLAIGLGGAATMFLFSLSFFTGASASGAPVYWPGVVLCWLMAASLGGLALIGLALLVSAK